MTGDIDKKKKECTLYLLIFHKGREVEMSNRGLSAGMLRNGASRRRLAAVLSTIVLLAILWPSSMRAAEAEEPQQYSSFGSIIVSFDKFDDTAKEAAKALAQDIGALCAAGLGGGDGAASAWVSCYVENDDGSVDLIISYRGGASIDEVLATARGVAGVRYAIPNFMTGANGSHLPDIMAGSVMPSEALTLGTALADGKAIDIPQGSSEDGLPVQLWDENTTPAQRFMLERHDVVAYSGGSYFNGYSEVGGAEDTHYYYKLLNVATGKALQPQGAHAAPGAALVQGELADTDAQLFAITADGTGGYRISPKLNLSLAIDVQGASTGNGSRLWLHPANGTAAQSFKLGFSDLGYAGAYQITASFAASVLDAKWGGTASGTDVWAYGPNKSMAQLYEFIYDHETGYYTIRNPYSGLVLDAAYGQAGNGANLWLYEPNGSWAQRWTLTRNDDATVTMRNALSGLAIDVAGANAASGADVWLYEPNGSAAQRFRLERAGDVIPDGSYVMASALGAKVLDVMGGSALSGTGVWTYAANGSDAQAFEFAYDDNTGYYRVFNPASRLCLDARAGLGTDGSGAWMYQWNYTRAQQWLVTMNDDGSVTLLNAIAHRALDVAWANPEAGAEVWLYSPNGSAAQRWHLQSLQ
jgi:hypothetical protein